MAKVVGTREGGRVVEKSDGTRVYYIRKRLAGKLYEVSTGATTLKAALAHLQRLQANPEGAVITIRWASWASRSRAALARSGCH